MKASLNPAASNALRPPRRPFHQRRPHRLGRPRVDVIDDRCDRLGDLGLRVLLDQPVPRDELPLDRLGEGRGEVVEIDGEDADPGIGPPRA